MAKTITNLRMTYLSKKRKLEFKSKIIDNPFYTFSINTYNIKKKAEEKLNITFDELAHSNYQSTEMRSKNKNAKTLSVDLWFLLDEIKSINVKKSLYKIELKQIIKLLHYMKSFFNCSFSLIAT